MARKSLEQIEKEREQAIKNGSYNGSKNFSERTHNAITNNGSITDGRDAREGKVRASAALRDDQMGADFASWAAAKRQARANDPYYNRWNSASQQSVIDSLIRPTIGTGGDLRSARAQKNNSLWNMLGQYSVGNISAGQQAQQSYEQAKAAYDAARNTPDAQKTIDYVKNKLQPAFAAYNSMTPEMQEYVKQLAESRENRDVQQSYAAPNTGLIMPENAKQIAANNEQAQKAKQELSKKYDDDFIDSLVDGYIRTKNLEQRQKQQAELKDASTGENILANVADVAAMPLRGMGMVESIGSAVKSKDEYVPQDVNSKWNTFTNYNEDVTEDTLRRIDEATDPEQGDFNKPWYNKAAKMIYQAGKATAESLYGGAMLGGAA